MVCESIRKIKYVLFFKDKKTSTQQKNHKAMKIASKRKIKEKIIINEIKIQRNE